APHLTLKPQQRLVGLGHARLFYVRYDIVGKRSTTRREECMRARTPFAVGTLTPRRSKIKRYATGAPMRAINSHFHWYPKSVFEALAKRSEAPRAKQNAKGGYDVTPYEGVT